MKHPRTLKNLNNQPVKKPERLTFAQMLHNIGAHAHRPSEVFAAFCKLAACAFSVGEREPEYLAELKRWPKDAAKQFAEALGALTLEMEDKPFRDLLGDVHMEHLGNGGGSWSGEFYTPHEICDMMARVTMGSSPVPKNGPITVCEPATGAGRMILSVAKTLPPVDVKRLRVQAIDVSELACHMTLINTTLWGIPTVVLHGNALSGQLWSRWVNVPMRMFEPAWPDIFPAIFPPEQPLNDYIEEALAELKKLAA